MAHGSQKLALGPVRLLGLGPGALGEQASGGFGDDVEEGDDVALPIADRAQREGEPGVGLLGAALTSRLAGSLHDERGVVGVYGGTTGTDLCEQGGDLVPDLRPHLGAAPPEGARVLGAEYVAVRIVVDKDQLRPAPEIDRKRRFQAGADRGAQRGRPIFDRVQRSRRPVGRPAPCAHLSIAGERVARVLFRRRHGTSSVGTPSLRARFSSTGLVCSSGSAVNLDIENGLRETVRGESPSLLRQVPGRSIGMLPAAAYSCQPAPQLGRRAGWSGLLGG